MMFRGAFRCFVFLLVVFWHNPGMSKDEVSEGFAYPELLADPTASERLRLELKSDHASPVMDNLPMFISGLATLASGLSVMNDPGRKKKSDDDNGKPLTYWAGVAGVSVGAMWIGVSSYLAWGYKPYESAFAEVNRMESKTMRQSLLKERIAEEHLASAASLVKILSRISAISNFLISGMAAATAKNNTPMAVGGISAILALGPLIFEHPWETIYNHQMDYKKKIYGPLVSSGFGWNGRQLLPTVNLTWAL